MTSPRDTAARSLLRAAQIGREAGLQFVYAGNLPGAVGSCEDTFCPSCRTALIRRRGFRILENRLDAGGACPQCAQKIPGVWTRSGISADDGIPRVHKLCG